MPEKFTQDMGSYVRDHADYGIQWVSSGTHTSASPPYNGFVVAGNADASITAITLTAENSGASVLQADHSPGTYISSRFTSITVGSGVVGLIKGGPYGERINP